MNVLKNTKLWSIFLLAVAMATYWPVISFNFPINPDAQYIFPVLLKISTISEYFNNLFSFQTIDFQPIRDLSLYIDLGFYNYFGINISVFHNLLLWIGACLVLGRIIKHVFAGLEDLEILLIITGFLVYPLFVQTISWGIARKHILTFLFILLATLQWIKANEESKHKSTIFATLFYFFSILSQPITLLWPLWAVVYTFLKRTSSRLNTFIKLIPAFVIMIVVTIINFSYYEKSPVFAKYYGTKTDELFEISDKILAFGHYLFQMLLPYWLSFTYTLGHWSTLGGLGLLGLIIFLVFGLKVNLKFFIIWATYILLPLAVVISKSRTLYDTYLLVPTIGLLFIFLAIKEKMPKFKFKHLIYSCSIIIWMSLSHYESSAWTDEVELTRRSFFRRPHCLTAFQYLRMSYENDRPPQSPEAKKFIYNYKCDAFEITAANLINLKAYLLYYEEDLSNEERIAKLEKLAPAGILPNLALVALNLKLKKFNDADQNIKGLILSWSKNKYRDEYIPIVKKSVYPYCEKLHNLQCLEMLKPFLKQQSSILYK